MNIVADIVLENERLTFEQADRILQGGIPEVAHEFDEDGERAIMSYRNAVATKLRQALLLRSLRERELRPTLKGLCIAAMQDIESQAVLKGIEAHTYDILGISDRRDVHPNLDAVQNEARATMNRVIRSLSTLLRSGEIND